MGVPLVGRGRLAICLGGFDSRHLQARKGFAYGHRRGTVMKASRSRHTSDRMTLESNLGRQLFGGIIRRNE